jgi:hypothetical protein
MAVVYVDGTPPTTGYPLPTRKRAGMTGLCDTMTSVHYKPPSFEELMGDIHERDWRSLVCTLNG